VAVAANPVTKARNPAERKERNHVRRLKALPNTLHPHLNKIVK
jgi:hypothetical protein